MLFVCCFVFFFKQKTAYEMRISDWSSDVCSSDLRVFVAANWLSALAFLACALFARSHESGLILFGLLALALGGSYTPAIILVSEATAPTRRGSAIGLLLTGSSLGYFVAIAACAGLADRKSVVEGKRVYVRVYLCVRRIIE